MAAADGSVPRGEAAHCRHRAVEADTPDRVAYRPDDFSQAMVVETHDDGYGGVTHTVVIGGRDVTSQAAVARACVKATRATCLVFETEAARAAYPEVCDAVKADAVRGGSIFQLATSRHGGCSAPDNVYLGPVD